MSSARAGGPAYQPSYSLHPSTSRSAPKGSSSTLAVRRHRRLLVAIEELAKPALPKSELHRRALVPTPADPYQRRSPRRRGGRKRSFAFAAIFLAYGLSYRW